MAAPIVTLTTDFGTRDSYVAQMKGVLLRLGPPELRVIDLGHEITAQSVREAALFVRECVPRFPEGTIHLVVVDPGVGSARRALARSWEGQRLVGPDNGVFGWLPPSDQPVLAHGIETPSDAISATFHGRDLFAPAAARLARGEPLDALGPAIADLQGLSWPSAVLRGDQLYGEVLHIDRFGNVITNLDRGDRHLLTADNATVSLRGRPIGPIREHYAQAQPGELLALYGSSGLLEIAVRDGSAALIVSAAVGDQVSVAFGEVPG
jgi:S-adenosyl-L-methionine hydrolase (adenosine-forming)